MRRPVRLVENYTVALTAMEYGKLLERIAGQEYDEGEVCAVGARSTTAFENTNELKILKYEEAMNGSNRVKWEKAVEEEYQRFEANKCFDVVDRKDVGSSKKIMTSTWTMKMKSSGKFRARLNARGYE